MKFLPMETGNNIISYPLECILNKVDPQFEATQGLTNRLSILLCQDGFSFLVTDAVTKKLLKLASYKLAPANFQQSETGGWPANEKEYFEQLKTVDCMQQPYQKVDIALASYKVTIAPRDFFESGNKMNIISAAHAVAAGDEILTEPVFDLGPVTAILAPSYVKKFCESFFSEFQLHSAPAIFVKGVIRKHSHFIARQVFLNIHNGYFEITVIQGSRLLYLNAFRYLSASDVLYYVIFVLEQLGFVPSEEKVTLMGEASENEIIISQLKMYCATLAFAEKPDGIEYGDAFAGIPMHTFFTLLNIPICE